MSTATANNYIPSNQQKEEKGQYFSPAIIKRASQPSIYKSATKPIGENSGHKRAIDRNAIIKEIVVHDPYTTTNAHSRSIAENINHADEIAAKTIGTPSSNYGIGVNAGDTVSNRIQRRFYSNINRQQNKSSSAMSQYLNVLSLKNNQQAANAYFDQAMVIEDSNNNENNLNGMKSLNSSVDNNNYNSMIKKSITANSSVGALGRLSVVSQPNRNNSKSCYRSSHKPNRLTSSMVDTLPLDQDQQHILSFDNAVHPTSTSTQVPFQQLMARLATQMNPVQFTKFRTFLASPDFLRKISEHQQQVQLKAQLTNPIRNVQNILKDVIGINLGPDDIQKIVKFSQNVTNQLTSPKKSTHVHTARRITSRQQDQLSMSPGTNDSLYYSNSRHQDNKSIMSIDSFTTQSRTSTTFSKPFTSYSFVSSTTAGTNLTLKIERMNRATIKLLAKQFIQCQGQLEQSLKNAKLTMKSKLTIPEMQMYLTGTDLQSVQLTSLQNLLVAALLIQQPNSPDILLSYKQLIAGCHNYIDQCDIEGKDVFNKTKMDKIMDDIRDFIYLKASFHQQQQDCKQMFMKYAEVENPEQLDRVVMTKDQFLKLCKHIVGDKYSSREIEQVYRNLVSKKPLNLKRFLKLFIHKPVEDIWWPTGLRLFREYMMRKKLDMETAFTRFVQGQSKQINKKQWRESVRKEAGISLNLVQIDFMFDKIDTSHEGFIDLSKWIDTFKDDAINPIQLLRELIQKNQLTTDDILYRLKKRLSDAPLTIKQFKECLLRLDSSLTQNQLKSLYDQLAIKRETFNEPLVEVPHLLKALTTEKPYEQVTVRREIGKKISEYIAQSGDVYQTLKNKLESEDSEQDGHISLEKLIKALSSCIKIVGAPEIEKYVRTLDKDQRGCINYQRLILKLENPKNNFPLKALAVRLTVFMQQNGMTAKSLLEKLIETKNSSKTNRARNKATSDQITTNFFAKFIKAKVDKRRTLEELKELVDSSIDMDKDGFIGLSDLEAFVGRASYHQFFERLPASTTNSYFPQGANPTIKRGSMVNPTDTQLHTIKQLEENLKKISSQNKLIMQKEIAKVEESQLYPIAEKPQSNDQQLELLGTLLQKLRQAMLAKGLKTLPQAFSLMDPESLGLVSFPSFSAGLDKITSISDQGKQQLFMKLDKLGIGLFSYDQFKKLLSTADGVALRLYEKDVKADDKFEWEQSVTRQILDWILDKRLSLADAFKIMDFNFDGVIQLQDLQFFLRDTFGIDINRYRLNVERLFKVMDLSKSGSIFLVDFENMFAKVFKQESMATVGGIKRAKSALQKFSKSSAGFVINWQESCIDQISRYLHDNYPSIQDSFNALTKTPAEGSLRMMKAKEFIDFIESKQILKGFNLTKELLYKLFAKLDTPHRKGYLIMQDWLNSFGNEQDGMDDLKRAMGQAFISTEDILRFLRTRGFDETTLTKEGFNKLLDHLLPNRFTASKIESLWKEVSHQQDNIPVHQFQEYFSGISFRPQNALTTQVAKHLQRTNMNNLDQLLGIDKTVQFLSPSNQSVAQIGLIVDKLRRILKTRGIVDIRDLFNGRDKSNLVEFKNAVKKVGLKTNEIEKLYEALTPGEPNEYTGMIDLKMLAEKIARIEFDNSLIEKKASENLKEFKELLIKHMNSIEDAFYLYDSGNKGKQTFEDFQSLVSHVYVTCDRKDLPNPVLLRDLFDTIDLKRDGLLDFYEWRQSFQLDKFNQREEFLFGRQMVDQQKEQQTSYLTSWPKNKVYYEFLTQVAKNCKPLVQMYQNIEDMPGYVDFDLGVAAFIKYIRESLNVSPKQYSDLYLQEMIKPFGELKHGQRMLNYTLFVETLKNRHYLVREAVNNRHAALPKAITLFSQ